MAALDIERNDTIVLIDDICVAGAARFWAIFRAFGASDVSVLDGGKMKWEREGRILDTQLFLTQQERDSLPEHTLDAKVQEWVALQAKIGSQERNRLRDLRGERQDWELVKGEEILDFEDVNACSYLIRNNKIDYELVDARGAPRFNAEVKEPREGVRSGHIPGAKNVPFNVLFNQDGTFKDNAGIIAEFEKAGIDLNKKIVTSCGSGVTASVLQLALEIINQGDGARRIYDGSWAEYGIRPQMEDEEIAKIIGETKFKNFGL